MIRPATTIPGRLRPPIPPPGPTTLIPPIWRPGSSPERRVCAAHGQRESAGGRRLPSAAPLHGRTPSRNPMIPIAPRRAPPATRRPPAPMGNPIRLPHPGRPTANPTPASPPPGQVYGQPYPAAPPASLTASLTVRPPAKPTTTRHPIAATGRRPQTAAMGLPRVRATTTTRAMAATPRAKSCRPATASSAR